MKSTRTLSSPIFDISGTAGARGARSNNLIFVVGPKVDQATPLNAATLMLYSTSLAGRVSWIGGRSDDERIAQGPEGQPAPALPRSISGPPREPPEEGLPPAAAAHVVATFDVSNRVFSLTDGFVPNHNAVYGVPPGAKHRHRRRRRGRRGAGGLEGVLAAGLGAGILASVFG